MSTILAVDTSCDACSVAVHHSGQEFARHIQAPRQHTQRLLPLIDELLAETGLSLTNLDAIAYGRGPGSFTGLRICLGVVQGLAFGSDIPVIPVSTLDVLAQGAVNQGRAGDQDHVLVALDARMQEVYGCLYKVVEGLAIAQGEEYVSSPQQAAINAQSQNLNPATLLAVGPGHHYPELSALEVRDRCLDVVPDARDILSLVFKQSLIESAIKAEEAQPVYLRDSVAWQKRQRIRQ
ncbi:tRNA (adenosine(37)-N6)-threonylcarbamoyltransferase complex dimerization subunit type 1 TsaB [Pseudomaricurvus alkylphenolicus]|uniref:tRNA (adenosine(37)-N6)-threonylcarbamoyltransferase complex dimerization subunit type 1 TsaB n=1 Tax=Pseudomaricurvus alkylphenolicus TaxID=1306991 RepID=UPI0014234DE0|nr:tRNA (adenosine(37)-N6)-threonylcarbamoyltransferase complex dimerization subunit type 1 TsaB [Pseudomaricurvus alkylphenolicus]NIB43293.1 tRNA (adenosine(37)-N6)-threonylcarbamoyltransferase complex dimerization subunit type 1 TsaB [Pseudomaricurvus alkylphenolicus]